jgi:ribosome maturation factor RimP
VGEVTGRVRAADDATVTFDVDGDRRTFAYDALGAGKVQVEFSRAGEGDER